MPILINQVFSLALSRPQDTSLVISPLLGHSQTPFLYGKSLDMTASLYHTKATFSSQISNGVFVLDVLVK